MLADAHFMSIADRSILACWGVAAARPAGRSRSSIDPGGPDEREVDALADAEPVRAGEVIRIRTTGGGGWGDPLERDPALVVRDVLWRKVSAAAALDDYGVVLTGEVDALDEDGLVVRRRGDRDGGASRSTGRARRGAVLRPRPRLRPAQRRSDRRRRRLDLSAPRRTEERAQMKSSWAPWVSSMKSLAEMIASTPS